MVEACIDQRESERYIGMLFEADDDPSGEWEDIYGSEATNGAKYAWRVTDRLTGSVSEGPIVCEWLEDAWPIWNDVWGQFADVKPKPVRPTDYTSHPNYGRF
jgi:hypothetical protein